MDDLVAFSPINFFQLSIDCYHVDTGFPKIGSKNLGHYQLPNLSSLSLEESFVDMAMGWNEEGIEVYAAIHQSCRRVSYPEVVRGDGLELFFDTRDVKTSGFNTRFCHHFFFLPEAFEGTQVGERTHFRNPEDSHPLCAPEDLSLKVQSKSNGYEMRIFIPKHSLYGYDPEQFKRLGFTYRVNRSVGSPQHFSVLSTEYQMEQQPSLWSSLNLVL